MLTHPLKGIHHFVCMVYCLYKNSQTCTAAGLIWRHKQKIQTTTLCKSQLWLKGWHSTTLSGHSATRTCAEPWQCFSKSAAYLLFNNIKHIIFFHTVFSKWPVITNSAAIKEEASPKLVDAYKDAQWVKKMSTLALQRLQRLQDKAFSQDARLLACS